MPLSLPAFKGLLIRRYWALTRTADSAVEASHSLDIPTGFTTPHLGIQRLLATLRGTSEEIIGNKASIIQENSGRRKGWEWWS